MWEIIWFLRKQNKEVLNINSFALNLFSQCLCGNLSTFTQDPRSAVLLKCFDVVTHFFSSCSFCHVFSLYKSSTKLFWFCTQLKSLVCKTHQLLISAYLWKDVSAPCRLLVHEHLCLSCTCWYFRSFFIQKRWRTVFFLSYTTWCLNDMRLLLMSFPWLLIPTETPSSVAPLRAAVRHSVACRGCVSLVFMASAFCCLDEGVFLTNVKFAVVSSGGTHTRRRGSLHI